VIETVVASEMMKPPSEARCPQYSTIMAFGISPGCSDRERVRGAIATRCDKVNGPTWIGEKIA